MVHSRKSRGPVESFQHGPFQVGIHEFQMQSGERFHRIYLFNGQGNESDGLWLYPEDIPHLVELCEPLAWFFAERGLNREMCREFGIYRELIRKSREDLEHQKRQNLRSS